mmetsp:Transcript_85160/g.170124  ORF Transcript_85160/g.170124 Transcript_85160/m.170124 type:complete len:200 (+) Transcript_85160:107-706(+)
MRASEWWQERNIARGAKRAHHSTAARPSARTAMVPQQHEEPPLQGERSDRLRYLSTSGISSTVPRCRDPHASLKTSRTLRCSARVDSASSTGRDRAQTAALLHSSLCLGIGMLEVELEARELEPSIFATHRGQRHAAWRHCRRTITSCATMARGPRSWRRRGCATKSMLPGEPKAACRASAQNGRGAPKGRLLPRRPRV